MKQWLAIVLAAVLFFSVSASVEAKTPSSITPNLLNTTSFKQMKAGTYKKYGIKLGMTDKQVIRILGKNYKQKLNYRLSGDKIIGYTDYKQAAMNMFYFIKKSGQYKLVGQSVILGKSRPTMTAIMKKYGKPSYKNIRSRNALLSYQHVQISFVRQNGKWIALAFQYANTSEIKKSEREFANGPGL